MRNPLSWTLVVLGFPISLAAQTPRREASLASFRYSPAIALAESRFATTSSAPEPHAIRWYEFAAVAGVIAGSGFLDDDVREYSQNHRTETKDDIARIFRHMGQPEVYATVGLGTLATGLIAGDDDLSRAGGRITASLVTAGVSNSLLKFMFGRKRPNSSTDPDEFEPFTKNASFPSGHTALAFALAASVSNEVHFWPAQVGLYSAATLTGWSRINDNKHWLSDVMGGAAVGVTSAMIMDGRWTMFGIGQPHFLVSPKGASVSMSFQF